MLYKPAKNGGFERNALVVSKIVHVTSSIGSGWGARCLALIHIGVAIYCVKNGGYLLIGGNGKLAINEGLSKRIGLVFHCS